MVCPHPSAKGKTMTPVESNRPYLRRKLWVAVTLAALVVSTLGSAATASTRSEIQALPTPKAFVSNLDLECFKTNPYVPPTTTLTLKHINPVLTGLPPETVTLGAREQLC